MLFNSFGFIFIFLPITLVVYFVIGRFGALRLAGFWLTLMSLVFYGVWNPWYLLLIVGSIIVNYWVGVGINRTRQTRNVGAARIPLAIGVTVNLVVLGYYKYANFFADSFVPLFGGTLHLAPIVLPLAISFFTFTQIAYLVDAYHGVTEEYDFLHYALFVSFFPHLIAGPIVSYRRLMPQFADPYAARFHAESLAEGISLFGVGLAKKVLIADNLAPLAQVTFDTPSLSPSFVPAWCGALAYTFQLYFDFSAYSDMAIGLARMFNVRFPLNFNSPYKARDISDFWRRWHMTLSHFLRDHLYIPLGGNRCGFFRRYLNLLVTMLLGGLWHGAGWTFLIWGGLHGTYLIIHQVWARGVQGISWLQSQAFVLAGWALTFLAVVVGWVFFRAHSVSQAGVILSGMAGFHGLGLPDSLASTLQHVGLRSPSLFSPLPGETSDSVMAAYRYLLLAIPVAFFAPNADEIFRMAERYSDQSKREITKPLWHLSPAWAVAMGLVFAISLLDLWKLSEFLYFRF